MTYATVRDIPASWDRYEPIGDALADHIPTGLLLHVAGPTDEGFRIIDIWMTREDFERFDAANPIELETLAPPTLREFDGIATIQRDAT